MSMPPHALPELVEAPLAHHKRSGLRSFMVWEKILRRSSAGRSSKRWKVARVMAGLDMLATSGDVGSGSVNILGKRMLSSRLEDED